MTEFETFTTKLPDVKALRFTDDDAGREILRVVEENNEAAYIHYTIPGDEESSIDHITVTTDAQTFDLYPGHWLVWPQLSSCILMSNTAFRRNYEPKKTAK